MAQRLSTRLATVIRTLPRRLLAASFLVFVGVTAVTALLLLLPAWAEQMGVTWAAQKLGLVATARCTGLCQGCYCDGILNGTCFVGGHPSGCIGCVGNCTGDNSCQCRSGSGGCGPVVAWCRSSDCRPRPGPTPTPTPAATATPTPPACVERVYDHIEPPRVTDWTYEPQYPVAIGQDPTFRGFDLTILANGGWAERRQVQLKRLCNAGVGSFPDDCPNDWHWLCREEVLVHHDDPIVDVDLAMRLADSSVAWLQGYLRGRYYGAHFQEGLPKVFDLWQGEAMSVQTGLDHYAAQDPGVHGGQIIVVTKGTPLNPPQRIQEPYEVPVYLMDTMIDR